MCIGTSVFAYLVGSMASLATSVDNQEMQVCISLYFRETVRDWGVESRGRGKGRRLCWQRYQAHNSSGQTMSLLLAFLYVSS
mmetsp:Transcript_11223/g.29608  ORF Transcript_11223/g.29608 Transcript_11223/m.29608 type:complete len:82 (+) Transcript_11223:2652-2897(+)